LSALRVCCINPPPLSDTRLGPSILLHRSLSESRRYRATRRAARGSIIVAAVGLVVPRLARSQTADALPQLGLGASSAFGVYSGAGIFPHSSLGPQFGGTLDLGWIGSRRVRFSVGLDYLATTIDRPDSLGVPQRGKGYVFSALADVSVLGSVARRVTPYVGAGVGVDAVGTTIQNDHIGAIYNTNVFDVHGQVGALVRVAPRGRLSLEVRGTSARVVRRVSMRVGYVWLYNQLR
jgi:hypothetical protein